jgi:peroxiredoxin
MAQLRQDYARIAARGAEVVVVGPEDQAAFRDYWAREDMPFVGLADPDHNIARTYGQRVNLFRLGRLPTMVIIDRAGRLRYRNDGESMRDIVGSAVVLSVLDALNAETVGEALPTPAGAPTS